MKKTLLIAWITVRELLHERVLYLLAFFAGATILVALLLGQLTYAEQLKLTVDFMLAAIELSMVLFAIFMGTSLFHREMTTGTVAMLLSKPIHRSQFLLGKFFGQAFVQSIVVAIMGAITVFVSLRFNTTDYLIPIAQSTLMIGLETLLMTAVTYFFAVNSGAVLTAVASGCVFVLGHLQDAFPSRTAMLSREVFSIVKGLVPNLDILNTKSLASYGVVCDWQSVAWAGLYTVLCIVFFLTSASLVCSRKDILT